MLSDNVRDAIVSRIREDEIVAMCCDVINIPKPYGVGTRDGGVHARGLSAAGTHDHMAAGRGYARQCHRPARRPGNGKCLMFNGHMDTSNTGDEDFLTGIGYKPHAVVKDGMIYGLGIYNMKGALVCYVHAVKALLEAGVKLEGDVILGAVCGEIEKTQWGEFQGKEYRGYGAGTHYLVSHGVLPDMCILGEPTDMKLVLEHAGSMWVRFGLTGNYMHSAFAPGKEDQNAIRRMYHVVEEVMRWIPGVAGAGAMGRASRVRQYRLRAGGTSLARQPHSGAGRSFSRRACAADDPHDRCPPCSEEAVSDNEGQDPEYGLEFETYVSVPGATIDENHAMVKAIERNHQQVTGKPPVRDTVLWCSDASVLSRFGCPTVNYGPSSGPRDHEGEKVAIKTLVDITKVYALTAAEICGEAALSTWH